MEKWVRFSESNLKINSDQNYFDYLKGIFKLTKYLFCKLQENVLPVFGLGIMKGMGFIESLSLKGENAQINFAESLS